MVYIVFVQNYFCRIIRQNYFFVSRIFRVDFIKLFFRYFFAIEIVIVVCWFRIYFYISHFNYLPLGKPIHSFCFKFLFFKI